MPITLDELYKQQTQQNQAVYDEQQRIAQEAAAKKRADLQNQMAMQRESYRKGLITANETASANSARVLRGLANKGLATSGLLQLGDIQLQAEKGKTVSNLSDAYRQAQRDTTLAGQDIESTLASSLNEAALGKTASDISASQQMYSNQMNESDRLLASFQTMVEAAKAGLTDAQYQTFNNAIAAAASGDVQALQDIISASGDMSISELFGNQIASEEALKLGGGTFKHSDPIKQLVLDAVFDLTNSSSSTVNAEGDKFGYMKISTDSNGRKVLSTQTGASFDLTDAFDASGNFNTEKANEIIRQKYLNAGISEYDENIYVDLGRSSFWNVKPFYIIGADGKKKYYKTWNLAVKGYKENFVTEE